MRLSLKHHNSVTHVLYKGLVAEQAMEVQVWFVGRKELSILEKGSTPKPWSVSHFFISIKIYLVHHGLKSVKQDHLVVFPPLILLFQMVKKISWYCTDFILQNKHVLKEDKLAITLDIFEATHRPLWESLVA